MSILFSLASVASAAPVTIDPSGSDLDWFILGRPVSRGPATVDLTPGAYDLCVSASSCFPFEVAFDGSVSGPANGAVTFTGSTVRFAPAVPVDVVAGEADVGWRIPGAPDVYNVAGDHVAWLLPDTSWSLCVSTSCFSFDVGDDGSVSGPPTAALSYDGARIVFAPAVAVPIRAGDADAGWRIPGTEHTYNVGGDRTALLLPETSWSLCISQTCLPFALDSAGRVTGSGGGAVDFLPDAIVFRPAVPVRVDPSGAEVGWRIPDTSATYNVAGPHTAALVPGTEWSLCIESTCVPFRVDAAGQVSGPANDLLQFAKDTLLFREAVLLTVEPSSPSVGYRIPSSPVYNVSGVRSGWFAPGAVMSICVDAACSTFVPGPGCDEVVAVGSASFHLTCDLPKVDTDGDGVDDGIDVCPDVVDPLQLDLDGDGLGDACDADLDGDGVPNGADTCPDAPNPDQVDLDHDGAGDACDGDDDGDGVSDDVDVCAGIPDVDQADTDGDGSGDACDPDDDGDGILDATDDCPQIANADQSDFDRDGEGDACDGDTDADGVANGHDACAATPIGQRVDADGCSAAQRIDALCGAPSSQPNLGRYVSCVAHVATTLQAAGLLTAEERAAYVRSAARR